ncbi:helix-turn-helix domain-containing protein [bacterium]|nr:helix-turn-helix domain-containing protein [bacterium]
MIGLRLRALREAAGLSRAELARGSGVDEQWVAKVETNKIESPGIDKLQAIAAYLRVDLASFWEDVPEGSLVPLTVKFSLRPGRKLSQAKRLQIERILREVAKGLISEESDA